MNEVVEVLKNLDKTAASAAMAGDKEAMLEGYQAMREIESNLELDGHYARSSMNVANVQVAMGRFADAATSAEDARAAFARTKNSNGEARALILKGNIMLLDGDVEGADKIAQKLISSPDWNIKGEAYLLAYNISMTSGDREKAYRNICSSIQCFDTSVNREYLLIALRERVRFQRGGARQDLAIVDEIRIKEIEEGKKK